MVPYLIRGLVNQNHQSVLMGNPPNTIADFIVELRRLEEISGTTPTPMTGETDKSRILDSSNDEFKKQLQALTERKFLPCSTIDRRDQAPIHEHCR